MTIFDDIKKRFLQGSIITRLIYVNVGIYVVLGVLSVLGKLMGIVGITNINEWLGLWSNPAIFWRQPWSCVSYMFVHGGVFHLLFNMLWLYWMGSMFLRHFSERQLLGVYLLGGFFGAAFFYIVYQLSPYFSQSVDCLLVGASGSVLAIVVALASYMPNERIKVFFIGSISMRYLALCVVLLDVLQITGDNAGGHLAHLGGAAFGFLYISLLRKGIDLSFLTDWLYFSLERLFSPNARKARRESKMRAKNRYRRPKTDQEFNVEKQAKQKRIDAILEKIRQSGYDSLSKEEKALLFDASK